MAKHLLDELMTRFPHPFKDPVIVNSVFLKKPQRIEVLGLVLLISLLMWRLIERSMHQFVEKGDNEQAL